MTGPRRIGILHPGEMGISVAASAQNSGSEVAWASEGRSDATRKRAASYGLRDSGGLADLAADCSILISVCPPHAAEDVAQQVLRTRFRGIYVDANAIAPGRAVALGDRMTAGGVRFVDGGIVGEPAWERGTTWLHLSGEAASEVAECLSAGPLQTTNLGKTIGRASALKMCFAANTKGTTALLAGILGTAERLGVREALEKQWNDRNPGFSDRVSDRVRNVTRKAWRFAGEMEEISATFSAAGMPGEFHAGAREVYSRLVQFKDVETAPGLADVLEALLAGAGEDRGEIGAAEPASFDIRPATAGDAGILLELIRGLAEYENLTEMMQATEEGIRQTLFGPRPAAEALLGFADRRPAGMAIFFHNYSTFLARPGMYLEDLFVAPEHRGQGLGKRLLARVAAIAVERECARLEWAVLDWNKPAIDFYRKRGAEMPGEWRLCRVTGDALRSLAGSAS